MKIPQLVWRRLALVAAVTVALAGTPIAGASPARAAAAGLSSALAPTFETLFAKEHNIPRRDVGGIIANSLRVAEDGHTQVQWAFADFTPATLADAESFQDGGDVGVFTKAAHHGWTTSAARIANSCARGIPAAVVKTWKLNRPALCGSRPKQSAVVPSGAPQAPVPNKALTAGGSIGSNSQLASIAQSQVGVLTNPLTTDFSPDCNPYTTLVGAGAPACGTDTTITPPGGSPEQVPDETEFWCADFTKWVWEQAGEPGTSTLNPGADSFYTWGVDHGESLVEDGTNPQVGDAIVLYSGTPGLDVSAQHVGIVTAVSNGEIETVNGDFTGFTSGADVGVYQWPLMPIQTYANAAEQTTGENWVLVTPYGLSSGTVSAFQTSGHGLWTINNAKQATSFPVGLSANTSPSLAVKPSGGYVTAFQANGDALWTINNAKQATSYPVGMAPNTSPSLAVKPSGGYVTAFQTSGHNLWTINNNKQATAFPVGMAPNTSPSLAILPTGGYVIAFQANTGALWTITNNKQATAFPVGMAPNTSPSLAVKPSGGYVIAFQTSGHGLWTINNNKQATAFPVGMAPNTSPSLAADLP